MQYEINHLHLELSSLCNARCPFCPRTFQGYPTNLGFTETNLSLATFKQIFSLTRLSRVHVATINGNFGDIVMNPESTDIIEYMLLARPDMQIRIHTNGSARDRQFWQRLGELKVSVVFGIDGLGETNNLYRQDTNFDNIMRNAQTFIQAGGSAVWDITEFEFNQIQLPEIRQLAAKMGFESVNVRQSDRNNGPVYNRQGQKIHFIKKDWDKWPAQIDQTFVQQQILGDTTETKPTVKINCWAKQQRSVYVAADGHVYPCCWTGFNPSQYRSHTNVSTWNKELGKYVHNNHAPTVGLEVAIAWFDTLAASWNTDDQPGVCQSFCNHDNNN